MNKVKELDKNLVNKIAAGEVIERPASVVKELVENSLDANADKIEIKLDAAGRKLIRVKDNGEGMNKEDAKKSIERHTTSKIENKEDLFSIKTLGFRGEALSSIASVSKMTIITKAGGELEGTKLEVEEGEITNIKGIGCDEGTIIEVRDLFYNTPARRKYMKTKTTELRLTRKYVENFILGYPDVTFRLIHNDNEILNSVKSKGKKNLISVYGHEVAKNLFEINYDEAEMKVSGFLSKPGISRNTKQKLSIFINDRFIECNYLKQVICDAYQTMLPQGKYPVGVIKVTLPPEEIDVNVHPAKKEIRFSNKSRIKDIVKKAVRESLETNIDIIPEINTEKIQSTLEFENKSSIKNKYKEDVGKQSTLEMLTGGSDSAEEVSNIDDIKIVGQMANSYILAKVTNGLRLIDQHAAQEKVYYNRLSEDDVDIQALIEPLLIDLDRESFEIVNNNLDVLKEMGFDIKEFGLNTVKIDKVPSVFSKSFDEDFFYDIIDALSKGKDSVKEREKKRIAMRACKSAVKAGQELTIKEIEKLVSNLMKTDDPYTCPHGRPTMINISLKEIEKMFERR